MTSNLKVILSAVGVAALVTSPALAKPHVRTNHVAPAAVPADAHAYVTPNAGHPLVTPYAPDVLQRPHETAGENPDFQLGSEK
jgi:hypothetical protein